MCHFCLLPSHSALSLAADVPFSIFAFNTAASSYDEADYFYPLEQMNRIERLKSLAFLIALISSTFFIITISFRFYFVLRIIPLSALPRAETTLSIKRKNVFPNLFSQPLLHHLSSANAFLSQRQRENNK
jgi:hypothetical protein